MCLLGVSRRASVYRLRLRRQHRRADGPSGPIDWGKSEVGQADGLGESDKGVIDSEQQRSTVTDAEEIHWSRGVIGRERTRGVLRDMRFEGKELREIIAHTPNKIELRNSHGRCCRILSKADALGLDLGLFVGVGGRRHSP